MDVELYVYDLSKGLARNLSLSLTGTQIDAIYHTSLVFGGVEYFYGSGIQQAAPGTTHHGAPIKHIHMGTCELPMDVIIEYMESLGTVYTQDSYDLFLHNCNNFTHDLSMFLVGKGIPDEIRNLPETFLSTPFGQMMKPYLDSALRPMTQGTESAQPFQKPVQPVQSTAQRVGHQPPGGYVHNVHSLREVEELLESAVSSCAVIFFTSATCPPCKMVYPAYDRLAEEAGDQAVLIKVDISRAFDVSMKYGIRATPTFITFLKGQKESEWSGANESQLLGNVRLLIQMAHLAHRHTMLRLPSFNKPTTGYVLYKKIPPLRKLLQKIGTVAQDPAIQGVASFIESHENEHAAAHLPDLVLFSSFVRNKMSTVPSEAHFAVIDLARVAFSDPRVSGFFAEEPDQKTLMALLARTHNLSDCPYNQQLLMTQLLCNLFASPLYPDQILSYEPLLEACIQLAATSMLDSYGTLRTAAAGFIYNLTSWNHNERIQNRPDKLPEGIQVELAASLIEALQQETENKDSLHGLLLSLGYLLYEASDDSEVVDLCRAMDVGPIIAEKSKVPALSEEPLLMEVGKELLEKGFAKN